MANDKDKKKKGEKPSKPFDSKAFKKGLYAVETNNGADEWNETSSATGRYQFLYNDIKDIPEMRGVTREQFANNYKLQEKIMDMALEGTIRNRPGYYKNATDLTKDYQTMYGDKWNYRADEVAALSHFLGRQGARDYLNATSRGEVYKVAGRVNLDVDDYLNRYNKGAGSTRGIAKKEAWQDVGIAPSGHRTNPVPMDINPVSFTPSTILNEGTYDKSQPAKQQLKPGAQQTSTDFLMDYINTNEFKKGGSLNNDCKCGCPGKPPCPPINVRGKDDPRYTAYQDSLAAFSANKTNQKYWDDELKTFMGDASQDYQDSLKLVHSEIGQDQKLEYEKHYDNNYDGFNDVSDEKVNAWENTYRGISPTSIGRSQLIDPKGNVATAYDASAVAEYPLYPKPKQEVRYNAKPKAKGVNAPKRDIKINKFDITANTDGLEMIQVPRPYDLMGGKRGPDDMQSRKEYRRTHLRPNGKPYKNQFEMGGKMKNTYNAGGQSQGGGMTRIPETSGTHETNPNNGVQVGQDQNGTPDVAEGGEAIKNNYVYSNALVLDETILKKVGLPMSFKGKTIADVAKKIQDPADEQVNDKVVQDTTKENLDKLRNANEILRLTEELLAPTPEAPAPQPGQEFNLGGLITSGAGILGSALSNIPNKKKMNKEVAQRDMTKNNRNSYFLGGLFGNDKDTAVAEGAAGHKINADGQSVAGMDPESGMGQGVSGVKEVVGGIFPGYAAIGEGAQSAGEAVFGDESIGSNLVNSFFDPGSQQAESFQKDSGWTTQERIASFVNPMLSGQMASNARQRKRTKENKENDARANWNASGMYNKKGGEINKNSYIQSFKKGGDINLYDNGGKKKNPFNVFSNMLQNNPTDTSLDTGKSVQGMRLQDNNGPQFTNSGKSNFGGIGEQQFNLTEAPNRDIDFGQGKKKDFWSGLGDKAAGAARYAPAAMNAIQLANLDEAEVESLDRLGTRGTPNYVDQAALENLADSSFNNAANALTSASSGAGELKTNLLAAHLNKQKATSQAQLKATQMNNQEDARVERMNLGIDTRNIGISTQEKDWNARNRGSYDTNRSKLLAQIGTDIGNIGLEETRKKYPERLGLLYDYLGQYTGGQNA